jgi:hypothetical protein
MTSPTTSILERRRDQMFPELDPLEIERMRRFGEPRNFAQGEVIVTAGRRLIAKSTFCDLGHIPNADQKVR